MKHNETEITRKDRNRDAWYGMVHVKDQSYLHQRSAKHYYNGAEDDIVVPTPMSDEDEDDSAVTPAKHFIKKALKITLLVLVAIFVIGMLVYIIKDNPGLVDFRPNTSNKIF